DGNLERDNGVCKDTYTLEFYGGQAPAKIAACKKNEVDVPDEVGVSLAQAKAHVEGQPLTPSVVFKPARPGQRLGIVLAQYPAGGTLSAYQRLTLVVAKSLHGAVPRLIGLSLANAEKKLAKLHLKVDVKGGKGKVIGQAPRSNTAAAPGMTVTVKTSG
ncbi:MAG TPA: PASTA domain-containing protein, partial [Gaiellaceae bacterium]